MAKKEKEVEVKTLEQPQAQDPILSLKQSDANAFLQLISVVLVGDDRAVPIQRHFVELIKRNNEDNSQQLPE